MLTPVEYSFLTPEKLGGDQAYRQMRERIGLRVTPNGYGLLHGMTPRLGSAGRARARTSTTYSC